ncbi:MAG: hypothetical protein BroJett026_37060 [Betaproteobacteria bacterium]|nr:MAG: hypothetical protein BroJett026_37060 [Betaproteobacteria bacterium]
MTTRCSAALDDATLEAWWLGDLDADAALRADEHLLGCATCAQRAEALVAIAHGVRDAMRVGAVRAVAGDALLERLAASGLRLREYRVPWNGSVNCTVAPDDDVMVARLQAPLAGVTRLDAVVTRSVDGTPERLRDLPFDPDAGEVVLIPPIAPIRALGRSTSRIELVAQADDGWRPLGTYTFEHTPWREG